MPGAGSSITNSYEYFIVLGETPLKSNSTYTKNIIRTSVNSNMPKNHKAVMKQEVCDWFIEKFTKENDLVLDCFMGIGTTGISCKKLNREFIGIK
jgi:DNA modification methylase